MNEYVYFRVKKDGVGWVSTKDNKTRTSLVTETIYKTKNVEPDCESNSDKLEILSNVDVLTLTKGNMDMVIELI